MDKKLPNVWQHVFETDFTWSCSRESAHHCRICDGVKYTIFTVCHFYGTLISASSMIQEKMSSDLSSFTLISPDISAFFSTISLIFLPHRLRIYLEVPGKKPYGKYHDGTTICLVIYYIDSVEWSLRCLFKRSDRFRQTFHPYGKPLHEYPVTPSPHTTLMEE